MGQGQLKQQTTDAHGHELRTAVSGANRVRGSVATGHELEGQGVEGQGVEGQGVEGQGVGPALEISPSAPVESAAGLAAAGDPGTAPVFHPSETMSTVLPTSVAPYSVSLEFFSGPMDLLLHLVARQELPIDQVQMSVVAQQYLEVVSGQAHHLDLEQASEFLVIAATLLAIKSRSLLPEEPKAEEEITGVWQDGNPFFESLRARIQEYQLTQARAEALRGLPQLGVHTFTRVDRKALLPTPEMLQEPEDAYNLGKLFAGLLRRIGKATSGITITVHPVSVVSVMVKIVDGFHSLFGIGIDGKNSAGVELSDAARAAVPRVSFLQMLKTVIPKKQFQERLEPERFEVDKLGSPSESVGAAQSADGMSDARSVVISGFVAVLELSKRGLISAAQSDAEGLTVGPPIVHKVIDEHELLRSEFDTKQEVDLVAEARKLELAGDAAEVKSVPDNVVRISDFRQPIEHRSDGRLSGNADNIGQHVERSGGERHALQPTARTEREVDSLRAEGEGSDTGSNAASELGIRRANDGN